ncbi:hypothetical protein JTB14_011502 [Gonioctena quinquepunctata]|nr:hypothetical protein JTB14_011502 [Gonioctena quinquepunctata]
MFGLIEEDLIIIRKLWLKFCHKNGGKNSKDYLTEEIRKDIVDDRSDRIKMFKAEGSQTNIGISSNVAEATSKEKEQNLEMNDDEFCSTNLEFVQPNNDIGMA